MESTRLLTKAIQLNATHARGVGVEHFPESQGKLRQVNTPIPRVTPVKTCLNHKGVRGSTCETVNVSASGSMVFFLSDFLFRQKLSKTRISWTPHSAPPQSCASSSGGRHSLRLPSWASSSSLRSLQPCLTLAFWPWSHLGQQLSCDVS